MQIIKITTKSITRITSVLRGTALGYELEKVEVKPLILFCFSWKTLLLNF